MTILSVFLLLGAAFHVSFAAEMMYDASKDFELKKPLVVPAAEASYHNTMIEMDTMVTGGNGHEPVYGLIGVILLDGVFTFTGIPEQNLKTLKVEGGKRCIPFKGINVVYKCNHEYFALNADFVHIQKTTFLQADTLSDVCIKRNKNHGRKFNAANDVGLKGTGSKDLVVRFGNRVLMSFKQGSNYNKCIGTYDVEDDYFTCMIQGEDGKLVGFEMSNFLFEPLKGKPHRAENTVEVFCKLPHVYQG